MFKWGIYLLISSSLLFFGGVSHGQIAEQSQALSEPEWELIVDKDKEIPKFRFVARRGHPEGRIRRIMKSYAFPSKKEHSQRNLIDYKLLSDGRISAVHFNADAKQRGTPENPGKAWIEKVFELNEVSYSIQDIERKILDMQQKPEIIYAMYQGVLGGPTPARRALSLPMPTGLMAWLTARY